MKIVFYCLLVLLGLFAGWVIFGGKHEAHSHSQSISQEEYTCSMHPQIRQSEPGKCPLCGMDLIPVANEGNSDINDESLEMSAAAVALADVEIIKAKKSEPQKMLRLYGNIKPNEKKIHLQTAHIGGRIEKLFINYEGENVKKGQIIANIFSPELLTAQTEFLETLNQPLVIKESAKERLRLLKISENQIENLELNKKTNPYINIVADANGIVIAKKTNRGEYIEAGSVLFEIADLSSVWAVFSAYESDLPYLNIGDLIGYTTDALPGQVFTGRVEFISPFIDTESRTAEVRMETINKNLKLKPGMLANALIHNAKISGEAIIMPKSAVLWTGERSIVYVAKKQDNGALKFNLREVRLGASLGDSIVVLSGILEGESIVASGVFAVDASAQLAGKNSMMNSTNNQGENMNKVAKLAAAALCATAIGCEEDVRAKAQMQPKATQATEQAEQTQTIEAKLSVSGACEMCEMRIVNTAKSINGVKNAAWNLETQTLFVEIDSSITNLDAISKALAAVGHDTEKDKASDMVYNSLPGCCKYRK